MMPSKDIFNGNNFIPKRFVFLEAEPLDAKREFERIMGKEEVAGDAAASMTKFMDIVSREAGVSNLDERTQQYLREKTEEARYLLVDRVMVQNQAQERVMLDKMQLLERMKNKMSGNINTLLEIIPKVIEGLRKVREEMFNERLDNEILLDKKTLGEGDQRTAYNFESNEEGNAREIVRVAATTKWKEMTGGDDVQKRRYINAMMTKQTGREFIFKKRQEFDNKIRSYLNDAADDITIWGLLGEAEVSVDDAKEIAQRINDNRENKNFMDDPEFNRLFTSLGLAAVLEGTNEDVSMMEHIRKQGKKAAWQEFAQKFEGDIKAWSTFTVAAETTTQSTSGNQDYMSAARISTEQLAIVTGLGMNNPKFCKVGTDIFAYDGAKWMRAKIDDIKNPEKEEFNFDPTKVFQECQQTDYISALESSEGLNKEVMGDIEAILGNQEEIVKRVGERLAIQKELEAFDRNTLLSWSIGALPPKNIQDQLSTAVDAEFRTMVERYKLNFVDKNILDNAKRAKIDAINEAFRNMDMPNIIAGIDKECRELSQQADPPQTYTPYEKFRIKIFPGGIRVVPEDMKPIHRSLFHGATLDSIRDEVTRQVELENNPLTKIPLIGPLLTLFLKDADPKMMAAITSIAGFFGLKTPPMGENLQEIIDQRVSERAQQVAEHYETLYPAISYNDLKSEMRTEQGIRSRRENAQAVMLTEDTKKFTGVLRIPAGKTLRSVQHINAKMQYVDDTPQGVLAGVSQVKAKTDTEQRENFYASSDKALLIYCENVVFKQYSNLPTGLKILEGGFENEEAIESASIESSVAGESDQAA